MASPVRVADDATLISELTVGVCVPSETVTVKPIFRRRRRLTRPVEVRNQVLGEIVANAIGNRRDLDRAQVLHQTRVRRFAIERLEAAGQTAGEQKRRGAGRNSKPRH